mmetsp:Transcript_33501/g.84889  ORF Transcript_33501/g.84889 Transcript_33501/m.84889 type:complete len:389 (-) Transcript_33501:687-1853(-)
MPKMSTGRSSRPVLTPRYGKGGLEEPDYESGRDTLADRDIREREGSGGMITYSKQSVPSAHAALAVEDADDEHNHSQRKRVGQALAGLAYITTSACLILFNKHALSNFQFGCPNSLLFMHCALAVALVKFCETAGLLSKPVEPLRGPIVRIWLPANLIFVGMIVSSFFALKLIGVGMFTVLKNTTNLLTMAGDYFFFGRTYGLAVWSCVALMIMSAAAGGLTDTHFTWEGYAWQFVNCVFTSAYSLYLVRAMDKVSVFTGDKQRLSEFSMVYYNNLLSLGPIALLVVGFGEHTRLLSEPALRNPEFLVVALMGGLLGFAISFTSLWFMARTTATVYSLTGSMNKVVVAVAGIAIFHETANSRNLISIGVGLLAGVVFVVFKAYAPTTK